MLQALERPVASDDPTLFYPTKTLDGEVITREARIGVLTEECVSLVQGVVRTQFELGRRLDELRDLCAATPGERWGKVLEQLGIQERTACRWMAISRRIEAFPSLRDFAEKQWSKAVALVEGLSEQDLERVAANEIPLLSRDSLDAMSVRELKATARKLREDVDKVVDEETRGLRKERDGLKKDLDALTAQVQPNSKAVYASAKAMRAAVQTLADQVHVLESQIAALDGHHAAQAQEALESAMQSGSLLLRNLWSYWQQRAAELGLAD